MKFKVGDCFLTSETKIRITIGKKITWKNLDVYKISWGENRHTSVPKSSIEEWIEKKLWVKCKYMNTPLWRKLEGINEGE